MNSLELDRKKLRALFKNASETLEKEHKNKVPETSEEIDKHPTILKLKECLKKYNHIEKLILLGVLSSQVYAEEFKELNKLENLEAISYSIFQSLRRSLNTGELSFVIGRMSNRIIEICPVLKQMLQETLEAKEPARYIT